MKFTEMIEDFWIEHGFQFELQNVATPGRGRGYRVVQIGEKPSEKIVGVRISSGGRMGNVIIQMINALAIAKKCGLPAVVANKSLLDEKGVVIERDGIRLYAVGSTPPDGFYLEGDFFYPGAFTNRTLPPSKEQQYDIAQRYLVPLIGPARSIGDDGELVVHIRSGDIFQPNPHPGYVQPPLAFYKTVLNDLFWRGVVNKVLIVCEDRENPCINALEAYALGNGIPCRVQSGTLREDVLALLQARHLVFGVGTFGAGICLLSEEVKTLNVFNSTIYKGIPSIQEGSIYFADAGYIKDGEWVCSAAQRQLMLDFPSSGLRKEA